jgi:UDP-galactopyranose mutase
MKYDYLVVGAGLFGAVFTYEAKKRGKSVLVIDRRDHIAGNVYTENVHGINVHRYGAHIFHTSNKEVWEYVNQFAEFNNYINSPIAIYKDELYNLPFNMNTFSKLWGIRTPAEAQAKIEEQRKELHITEPKNLEEQALSLAGRDVYEKLIKGYTEKQWGRPPSFRLSSSNVFPSVSSTTTTISTIVIRESPWAVTRRSLRKCWTALM